MQTNKAKSNKFVLLFVYREFVESPSSYNPQAIAMYIDTKR